MKNSLFMKSFSFMYFAIQYMFRGCINWKMSFWHINLLFGLPDNVLLKTTLILMRLVDNFIIRQRYLYKSELLQTNLQIMHKRKM